MHARLFIWLVIFVTLPQNLKTVVAQDRPIPDPLIDFDPSGLIRFDSMVEAEAKRNRLIRYI